MVRGVKRRDFLRSSALGLGVTGLGSALLSGPAAAAEKPLTIAIPNNAGTLDPMNQVNHDAMAATHMVFENLMVTDDNGELHPQLAAAPPKISDDKLTYWFDLRDDVSF